MANAKHHRSKLVRMEIPAEHAEHVLERVVDILGFHVANVSAAVPLAQQMKSLAFDAYTQGLIDGAQVGSKMTAPPPCSD